MEVVAHRPISDTVAKAGAAHVADARLERELESHYREAFPQDRLEQHAQEFRQTGFTLLSHTFFPKNLLPRLIRDHHAVADSDPAVEQPDVYHRAMTLEDTGTPRVYQATPQRTHVQKMQLHHAILTSKAFEALAARVLGNDVLPTPEEFKEDELISHRLGRINPKNAHGLQADTHGAHFDPAWVAAVAVTHAPPAEHGMLVQFAPPDKHAPPPPMADAKRIFETAERNGTLVTRHIPSNSVYFLDARLAAHQVSPTKTNLPKDQQRLNTTRAIHVAHGDPRSFQQKLEDFDAEVTATQQGATADA